MVEPALKLLRFPTNRIKRSNGYRQRAFQLAPRYRRVLSFLSEGLSPNEVADRLGVARATAWNYIEDEFIKDAELRQRLAAHVLSLLGEEQGNG